jgi:hypothetical protein
MNHIGIKALEERIAASKAELADVEFVLVMNE